jgi:hypothetical protein
VRAYRRSMRAREVISSNKGMIWVCASDALNSRRLTISACLLLSHAHAVAGDNLLRWLPERLCAASRRRRSNLCERPNFCWRLDSATNTTASHCCASSQVVHCCAWSSSTCSNSFTANRPSAHLHVACAASRVNEAGRMRSDRIRTIFIEIHA